MPVKEELHRNKMHVPTFVAGPRVFEICWAGVLSVTVISGSF